MVISPSTQQPSTDQADLAKDYSTVLILWTSQQGHHQVPTKGVRAGVLQGHLLGGHLGMEGRPTETSLGQTLSLLGGWACLTCSPTLNHKLDSNTKNFFFHFFSLLT